MQYKPTKTDDGKLVGYVLKLSSDDTYRWANGSDNGADRRWPGSYLSGRRFVVVVDKNGLCDLTINGKHSDGPGPSNDELSACVADHIPADTAHLWPA